MSANEYRHQKYDGNLIRDVAPEALITPFVALISFMTAIINTTWIRSVGIAVVVIVTFIVLWFFRSPVVDRSGYAQLGPLDVVSPSYGTVAAIDQISLQEVKDNYGNLVDLSEKRVAFGDAPAAHRIVSFLNVFDVHVQCAPFDSVMGKHIYHEGSFQPAMFLEKSQYNERNITEFVSRDGSANVFVVLIAGLLARKIMIFPEYDKGDTAIERGEKYAIIKFGSRVDTIVPLNYKIAVNIGDKLTGGSTVLAYAPK